MYAIVDIETTGGFAAQHRIIEIAVVFHDGEKITGHYQQLLNPRRSLPAFITGLTGIDAGMLADAPDFSAIANDLWDLLEGKIFVAHNVSFDYNFVKQAFAQENKDFKPRRLCTVRLGRKIFPGLRSYSLGQLCEARGIRVKDRHRALGDAWATALLFEQMLREDRTEEIPRAIKGKEKARVLPPNISHEQYRQLPTATGVYYFHDKNGKVIYVGKAVNIKSRFEGHFTGKSKVSLKSEIHAVSFEVTGSELLALLLETLEIKRLWPKYNRSLKVKAASWGIFAYSDQQGFQRFQVNKIFPGVKPILTFSSHAEAWKKLLEKTSELALCPKLTGIQKTPGACYDFALGKCAGACCGFEAPEAYNRKAAVLWEEGGSRAGERFLIKDRGRNPEEEAVLLVEDGFLAAFGYIDQATDLQHSGEVLSFLKPVKRVVETQALLQAFLPKLPQSRIIPLAED
ncbi:DNA polymerase-3 subunit epsilon [Cyclobacterium xiamenense]|uniref:DNA polymerase-3 subunit epsilon n=1 Tax=Cyclobacterium xiamenense TaxID=1297121 RepID=A0A1H6T541_9BACT|nr:exonuclease domain-containing protein [Cyclobacterium xiamenense]SEI74376.1 DNA polymerase-3 subunit epsilon [Cyclobacterium xiamenense]